MFIAAIWMNLAASAVEPVKLSQYPQKVRTFFGLSDTNVPAALSSNGVSLPVGGITAAARASDGATWLGTTQGLMRLDLSAPDRDRRQLLTGLRYLPDDHVQQLLPDAQGGVWVRTRMGVSHIELKPMTLAQKSEVFEQRIRARHDRYGLTASSHLSVAGDSHNRYALSHRRNLHRSQVEGRSRAAGNGSVSHDWPALACALRAGTPHRRDRSDSDSGRRSTVPR